MRIVTVVLAEAAVSIIVMHVLSLTTLLISRISPVDVAKLSSSLTPHLRRTKIGLVSESEPHDLLNTKNGCLYQQKRTSWNFEGFLLRFLHTAVRWLEGALSGFSNGETSANYYLVRLN